MSEPVVIKIVQHKDGSRHAAMVQKRSPRRVRRFGGKRFAAWARRVQDGIQLGAPERFDTYGTEAEAVSHAIYAASAPRPKVQRAIERRKKRRRAA